MLKEVDDIINIQLQTELCELFQIRYPLLQAGDGRGTDNSRTGRRRIQRRRTRVRLYGAGAIRDSIQEIRKRTDQPLPSTFCARCRDRHERIGEVQQELNRMRDDLGIPHAGKDRVATDWFGAIRGSDRKKVPVISTAFGILDEPHMRQAKAARLRVVAMATSPRSHAG